MLKGLRVGVVRHFFETGLLTDPETVAALENSLTALRDMEASVNDVPLAPYGVYTDTASLISPSETFAIHRHWLRTAPEKYGAYGRHRLMAGAFASAADYINAQRFPAAARAGRTGRAAAAAIPVTGHVEASILTLSLFG